MRPTDFVESYIDAWNHQDPVGVAEHLAAGGIYCDVPYHTQKRSSELVAYLREFFTEDSQRYELVGEILTGENTIAFQYRMYPLADSANAGSQRSYRGAEFMTLHGESAMTIIDYYDVPGLSGSSTVPRIRANKSVGKKYAKSGLSDELFQVYRTRLERLMQIDRAYVQSNLTLPRLAKAVGCSPNHLSQVINSGFGMSFFDYLNQHRINHAKKLLSCAAGHRDAILNIAFDVGFNSNSAFYSAFRKRVGITPAQFRKSAYETGN